MGPRRPAHGRRAIRLRERPRQTCAFVCIIQVAAIRACCKATRPANSPTRAMMRTRRPLCHPLADVFWRAVDSIATSLCPDTVRSYRAVTRSFLRYLGADHHEIHSLKQLRRDPHILGWLAHL